MRRRITIAALAVLAGTLMPMAATGHCYSGQKCEPDPLNLHHGGLSQAPPEVKQFVGVMEKLKQAKTQQTVRRIIVVPKLKPPVDPQTDLPRLPKLDLPPGGARTDRVQRSASTGNPLPQESSLKQPDGPPLTPAEFARQAPVIRNAKELETASRGVFGGYREMLNAITIETVTQEDPTTASGRFTSLNLNITSKTLERLKAYSRIMEETRVRTDMGGLQLPPEVLTDMERVYRATQSIIQLPE